MIDIETDVYQAITTALATEYPNMPVYGETVLTPSVFPCVSVEQADNYTYQRTADSAANENHATVMFEVNVFSNKQSGKKTEAKAIFAIIANAFNSMGFNRMASNPININDATAYRLFGRFSAVVSTTNTIYGR